MSRPKDSRSSNRYKGNQHMIDKVLACADKLTGCALPAPQIQRDKRIAAQLKRERKQQKRIT